MWLIKAVATTVIQLQCQIYFARLEHHWVLFIALIIYLGNLPGMKCRVGHGGMSMQIALNKNSTACAGNVENYAPELALTLMWLFQQLINI